MNPIIKISSNTLRKTLWILGISTLVLFVFISILDQPLRTNAAPNGIVSFELAGTFNKTQNILSSWNQSTKLTAIRSLIVDYLFLIAYSFFFAFLIFWLSIFFTYKKWLISLGIVLGWLQFLAAFFDALENYFLLRLLFNSQNEIFPSLAFYFASVKFIIIFLGILYIFGNLFIHFFIKKYQTN